MVGELERRQDQLLQAKKPASLGTLTSGIAHQLNNPLNNISTSCQILLEELGPTDSEFPRKMLTNIEQEVHRARDIVRGLLEFSRVKEFCLLPTPLSQVVERSVSLISSQVPPGIEITRVIPEEFFSHEVFMLAGVPVHDAQKELNITRAQIYTQYTGLTPPDSS